MNSKKFHRFLERQTSTRNILILVGFVVVLMGAVFPLLVGRLRLLSGGVGMLDTLFNYSPEKALEMLASYGEDGRRFYLGMLLSVDLLYPLVYGLLFVLLFLKASGRLSGGAKSSQWWVWLPTIPVAADYAENAAIGLALFAYPAGAQTLAHLASFFTAAKWSTLAAVGGALGLTWLAVLIKTRQKAARV